MADKAHLGILTQGPAAWNAWRADNARARPDLSYADLSGADLARAHLSGAYLSRTDLRRADLRHADLRGGDLSYANLNGASLNDADLSGAHLDGAHLDGADLSGALLVHTALGRVDLRGVRGLDESHHAGPSTVGIDTLYSSEGDIPETFLRNCGVPDDMIEFAWSISGAIQLYSCFISYAARDEAFARRLYGDLAGAGIRCWLAPEDIKPGDRTWQVIDSQIRIRDKLLLIMSEAAIESAAVEREVAHGLVQEAKRNRQIVFPIYIDGAALRSRKGWVADLRRERNSGDFTAWQDPTAYEARLQRVIDWLNPSGSLAKERGVFDANRSLWFRERPGMAVVIKGRAVRFHPDIATAIKAGEEEFGDDEFFVSDLSDTGLR